MKKLSVGLACCLLLSFMVLIIQAQELGFTAKPLVQQANATLGFVLSPDGSKLIVGAGPVMVEGREGQGNPPGENKITIWDIETGEMLNEFDSTAIFVADLVLSADGTQVIGALSPDTVGIWDIETGELVRQYSNIYSARLSISSDGQMVISNARGAHPVLWNFETGKVIHTFDETSGLYGPTAFSPDAKILAFGSDVSEGETVIILWSTETMSEMYRLEDILTVTDVDFSPDGQSFAIATVDRGIQIFDVATGEVANEIREYQTPDGEISNAAVSLAYSADGTQLLSSWDPSYVVLWDIETATPTYVGSHETHPWQVSFTPDGVPVSSSYDGMVQMWNMSD
jgi:WD40 repeat protein